MTTSDDLHGPIVINTLQGECYTLPCVSSRALLGVLPESGRTPASVTTLTIVNSSGAVLAIPFRIIRSVSMYDCVLWCRND